MHLHSGWALSWRSLLELPRQHQNFAFFTQAPDIHHSHWQYGESTHKQVANLTACGAAHCMSSGMQSTAVSTGNIKQRYNTHKQPEVTLAVLTAGPSPESGPLKKQRIMNHIYPRNKWQHWALRKCTTRLTSYMGSNNIFFHAIMAFCSQDFYCMPDDWNRATCV